MLKKNKRIFLLSKLLLLKWINFSTSKTPYFEQFIYNNITAQWPILYLFNVIWFVTIIHQLIFKSFTFLWPILLPWLSRSWQFWRMICFQGMILPSVSWSHQHAHWSWSWQFRQACSMIHDLQNQPVNENQIVNIFVSLPINKFFVRK